MNRIEDAINVARRCVVKVDDVTLRVKTDDGWYVVPGRQEDVGPMIRRTRLIYALYLLRIDEYIGADEISDMLVDRGWRWEVAARQLAIRGLRRQEQDFAQQAEEEAGSGSD